ALAAEHGMVTKSLGQQVEMAHAIEQRQNRGVRSDRGRKRQHRLWQVVSLATEQNEVVRLAESPGLNCRCRQIGVSPWTADREAGACQLLASSRSDEEGYVPAALQQPAAKVAANGTGADDQDAHVLLLRTGSGFPWVQPVDALSGWRAAIPFGGMLLAEVRQHREARRSERVPLAGVRQGWDGDRFSLVEPHECRIDQFADIHH